MRRLLVVAASISLSPACVFSSRYDTPIPLSELPADQQGRVTSQTTDRLAVTGARIALDVDADGAAMGSVVARAAPAPMTWTTTVHGTAPDEARP